MAKTDDRRRRWLGAIFLLAALAMLIAGESVLRNRLEKLAFVAFWLVCFTFTGLAIMMAFLDALALRRRAREQQRELIENTVREIARQKEMKSRQPPEPDGGSN
jgi:membrane protein implicated in regulation of membrane protease activity